MNLNKIIKKHYLSFLFFILLILIASTSLFYVKKASADSLTMGKSLSSAKVDRLMSLMNINPIPDPAPPPGFNLPSLSGKNVSLDNLKGKVALISFWTTW